jgi:tRNA(fMet)-specific endonuclease VapC
MVTAILRSHPGVMMHLRDVANANDRVLFSVAVYYEIKRGLLKRDAMRRLALFEELVRHWEWLGVERHHWEAAAALWAQCRKAGVAVTDVDLLLAVQSSYAGAILVTHDNDFERFGVECEDWLAS